MKNFFKKLSFVLAIAMVLTSIAPATASAAEISAKYVPAKKVNLKVNSEKVDAIDLEVGETVTVKVGLPVTKAAKEAGFTKSTFKTYYSVEGTAVEVLREGNRTYNVTAVEAGEATITIGAAKNNKKAQAGEFKKTATLAVTVATPATEVTAVQSGANKITVTGKDLTDVLADYAVKRGNVTLATKAVTLNEEKTEAVIEAAASNMPKGDYTLTFKDSEAVEFTVVAAAVDSIVIEPENAILVAGATNSAVAYYKVFNQFGEDVTSGPLGATVQATGSDNPTLDKANKKITFTSANPYTMNLSQVSVALVCSTNGVNTSKILTVSEASKLASVEFAGLYKFVSGKYVPATLKEGTNAAGLANHYLFFKGVDQYGRAFEAVDGKLQVNALSTTGLTVATTGAIYNPETWTTYIPYTLGTTPALYGGTLAAGTVSLMTVVLNNGTTATATIEVAPATKVDTLTVADLNGVYGAQDNELYFEAYDVDGNPLTDYATLSSLNNTNNITQYPNVRFERRPDGTAKLMYNARPNTGIMNLPDVLTFLTPTNKFTSANLNIQPNCVPKAIVGIDSDVALGAVNGHGVSIVRKNVMFQDQYGNIMADNSAALDTVTLQAVVKGYTYNFDNGVLTGSGTALGAQNSMVVSAAGVNSTTSGAVSVTLSIEGVEGSDYTFNIYSVALDDMTDFTVGDFYYYFHEDENFDLEALTAYGMGGVYGYYNGAKVRLDASQYEVLDADKGNDVTAPSIVEETEGRITKDGSFKVLIHNTAATVIEKSYQYSNTYSATTLSAKSPYAPGSYYYTRKMVVVSNSATSGAAAEIIDQTVTAEDQYGADTSGQNIYVTFSGYPVDPTVCEVTNNGQTNAAIEFHKTGFYTVTVKFTTLYGVELVQDITFEVID